MTESGAVPAAGRRAHILRLAVFAAFLATLFYLVAVRQGVDIEAMRAAIAASSPPGPIGQARALPSRLARNRSAFSAATRRGRQT